MKNKPQELLKGLLDHPEDMSMDRMESLVKTSLSFFNEFLEVSKSGDKEAQEKALKELLDFKDALQALTQKAAEITGLSTDQLMQVMSNPENLTAEQKQSMTEINESIASFSKTLMGDLKPKMQKETKIAQKTHRITV
jgi:hypothetical protein